MLIYLFIAAWWSKKSVDTSSDFTPIVAGNAPLSVLSVPGYTPLSVLSVPGNTPLSVLSVPGNTPLSILFVPGNRWGHGGGVRVIQCYV